MVAHSGDLSHCISFKRQQQQTIRHTAHPGSN
jgi:hypothetical protein